MKQVNQQSLYGIEFELRDIIFAELKDSLGLKAGAHAAYIASSIVARIRPHEEIDSLYQLGLASRKYFAAIETISPAAQDSGLGKPGDDVFKVAEKALRYKKWAVNRQVETGRWDAPIAK